MHHFQHNALFQPYSVRAFGGWLSFGGGGGGRKVSADYKSKTINNEMKFRGVVKNH